MGNGSKFYEFGYVSLVFLSFCHSHRQNEYTVNVNTTNIINVRAKKYFYNADPVLAAACDLGINDAQKAVQMLFRGHEIDLAFVVSKLLKV